MQIYGEDLWRMALRALAAGQRRSEVAHTLGVFIPTLDHWRRAFRESGQDAPRARGHRRNAFSPDDLPRLKAQVQASPDLSIEEHVRVWQEHSGRSQTQERAQTSLGR